MKTEGAEMIDADWAESMARAANRAITGGQID
jgi:hypothetical protein